MPMGYSSNNWMPPNNYYGQEAAWQQWNGNNNINTRQQPVNNLLRVTGPESAKAYALPPNSNVILFDAENPIFYCKSTDDSGFATLRTFIFEEQKTIEPPKAEQIDVSNFATKNDLDALEKNILEMKQMLEGLVN